MPTILFQGPVLNLTVRVVDRGSGTANRIVVEQQLAPDAMGTRGWGNLDPMSTVMFQALLIAAGIIAP